MAHFAFPGNIDFAADSQGAFSCFIHEKLMYLFIVCETVFTIDESRAISYTNDTQQQHNKWLQFLAEKDFPPKFLWSENANLKFSVNNEGEDVN